ncbi:outer membrane beta-barrel protein [uncultured Bacteroides sp.]|uniref:outer membrane beta-barrel protein n=1 Tax=uncultured Bacteroides sp. TaxID=162156 RepID=UPI002AAC4669|nr:outer membrane beta-barrel protein [uncultured Bacteroides sp.]
MKQEEEEKWISALRNSLEDYSEPPMIGSWERLQKELSSVPVAPKKRSFTMFYAAAAAVILLFVISTALIMMFNNSSGKYMETANIPKNAEEISSNQLLKGTIKPLVNSKPLNGILALNKAGSKSASATRSGKAMHPGAAVAVLDERTNSEVETLETTEKNNALISNKENKENRENEEKTQNTNDKESENKSSRKESFKRARKTEERATEFNTLPRKKSPKNLSVAIFSGNNAGISGGGNNGNNMQYEAVNSFYSGSYLFTNCEEISYSTISQSKWNHKQPVTFGLSIRKQLSGHFALESGITYTMLESEASNKYTKLFNYKQTLQYLGIPVKLNYMILDKRYITLYLSGGGMVEKSISGKMQTEKISLGNKVDVTSTNIDIKPLQWSVSSTLGIQFNATRQLGAFVEPGIIYYFDDGSNIETIRKETPFNINLQLGLRFTY